MEIKGWEWLFCFKREKEQPPVARRRYCYEEVDHTRLFLWLADAARYYADNGDEEQYIYQIKIEGCPYIAIALYIPGARRMGIYSGYDMAWASNVSDAETAIDDYVQAPELWGELPHLSLPTSVIPSTWQDRTKTKESSR